MCQLAGSKILTTVKEGFPWVGRQHSLSSYHVGNNYIATHYLTIMLATAIQLCHSVGIAYNEAIAIYEDSTVCAIYSNRSAILVFQLLPSSLHDICI